MHKMLLTFGPANTALLTIELYHKLDLLMKLSEITYPVFRFAIFQEVFMVNP